RGGRAVRQVLARTGYVVVLHLGRRVVRRMGAVLQPAVAVRGERYGRGGRDVQPVGEAAHQPVQVGGGLLGDRDRGAHGGPGPGDDQGAPGGGQQDQNGDRGDDRAGHVPARAGQMPGGAAGEQDHRSGGGEQGDGQGAAAHPQHGDR